MALSLALWSSLLFTAAEPAARVPLPRLAVGEELIYSGTFVETIPHLTGVREENHPVEIRLICLDRDDTSQELALVTSFRANQESVAEEKRLPLRGGTICLLKTDVARRLFWFYRETPPSLPLRGYPVEEVGMLQALGFGEAIPPGTTWTVAEPDRPEQAWKFVEKVTWRGTQLALLKSEQLRPLEGNVAMPSDVSWARNDTLWQGNDGGAALRVARRVEVRQGIDRTIAYSSSLDYQLSSRMRHRGKYFELMREEVRQAAQLFAYSRLIDHEVSRSGTKAYALLEQKIQEHLRQHERGEDLPYRDLIDYLLRRVEQGKKGDLPPELSNLDLHDKGQNRGMPRLQVDLPLPAFANRDLADTVTIQSRKLVGRAMLLVYYRPAEEASPPMIKSVQRRHELQKDLQVIGIAAASPIQALKQLNDLSATFPVIEGEELFRLHRIEKTPRIIFVDEDGIVRHETTGWSEAIAADWLDWFRKRGK